MRDLSWSSHRPSINDRDSEDMSSWVKTLVVLALVVPMTAYVAGSLVSSSSYEPSDRRPVIIQDAPSQESDRVRETSGQGERDDGRGGDRRRSGEGGSGGTGERPPPTSGPAPDTTAPAPTSVPTSQPTTGATATPSPPHDPRRHARPPVPAPVAAPGSRHPQAPSTMMTPPSSCRRPRRWDDDDDDDDDDDGPEEDDDDEGDDDGDDD